MIDYLVRAETKATWDAYALEQGWIDQDGNPAQGVLIDELGPVVVTPPVYDPVTGEETVPAVMDPWHHVNLRIVEAPTEDEPPAVFAKLFAEGRAIVTPEDVHAIEGGVSPNRIEVLYPEDIETPIRVWADGMYPAPLPDIKPAPK